MNRRMPNGTYGGVRGWGREAPAYSIRKIVLGDCRPLFAPSVDRIIRGVR
jgi:hypothetical protein